MRRLLTIGVLLLAMGACSTSSYNMPEAERSRNYAAPAEQVFDAAVDAMSAVKFAVVEADREDLAISGRKGMTMTSWRGFVLRIILIEERDGTTTVQANVEEAGSQATDWGSSKKYVKDYLAALDRIMSQQAK